jgi:two-component system, LuxR family, sensor kinase FixL
MIADTSNTHLKASKPKARRVMISLSSDTDWAQLALEATGTCVLILDASNEQIAWKSTSFSQQFPLARMTDSVHGLMEIFKGLGAVYSKASSCTQAIHANVIYSAQEKSQFVEIVFTQKIQPLGDRVYIVSFANYLGREQAERRRLEDREKLLFTSRSVSVGEMATTLAHELNQPIGSIANLLRGVSARMRNSETADTPENFELIQAISRATEQAQFASRIIARIREFTHSRQPKSELVDVNAMLRSTAQLLDWELSRDCIAVELNITSQLCMTVGDEVMLEQVIVNLIRNAIDAMRQSAPKDRRLSISVARVKSNVEVKVSDSGCGMTEETEASVFVPFVSTKPTGMGIGLSICRSFVEMHQGRIWFTRNPIAGVTFHLSLPAHQSSLDANDQPQLVCTKGKYE